MSGEELRAALEAAIWAAIWAKWDENPDRLAGVPIMDVMVVMEVVRAALAAPSTPEPIGDWSRLPAVAQVVLDSWPEEGMVVTRDQVRSLMEGARLDVALWAAPSTEPALDERLLTDALASFLTERGQYRGITPERLAAEYARLAESQP